MTLDYLCPETVRHGSGRTRRCLLPVEVDVLGTMPSTGDDVLLVRTCCPAGHRLCGPHEILEIVAADEAA